MMEQPPSPPPQPLHLSKPDSQPDNSTPNSKPGGGDHHDAPNTSVTATATAVEASDEGMESSPEPPARTGSGRKSVHWSPDLVTESRSNTYNDNTSERNNNNNDNNNAYVGGSNPYISSSLASASLSFNLKETMGTVKDVLGRCGKKVGEATRKAEDLAGNTWQHLKTAPSFTDAALGRIAQGTKVLAQGGHEKIFRQTFETDPEEELQNSYACYLSTSAGPVMGMLYVSTAKLAFCSDNPLSYKSGDQTEWSYYKVVIPLHQLKAVVPSASRTNPAEKYIQVISVDNHEFWFVGFLNYDGAVEFLQSASEAHHFTST